MNRNCSIEQAINHFSGFQFFSQSRCSDSPKFFMLSAYCNNVLQIYNVNSSNWTCRKLLFNIPIQFLWITLSLQKKKYNRKFKNSMNISIFAKFHIQKYKREKLYYKRLSNMYLYFINKNLCNSFCKNICKYIFYQDKVASNKAVLNPREISQKSIPYNSLRNYWFKIRKRESYRYLFSV